RARAGEAADAGTLHATHIDRADSMALHTAQKRGQITWRLQEGTAICRRSIDVGSRQATERVEKCCHDGGGPKIAISYGVRCTQQAADCLRRLPLFHFEGV
ncbi:MAG TPA: hypothetical protein VF637_07675, partial [Sphingomicrobium sp.]